VDPSQYGDAPDPDVDEALQASKEMPSWLEVFNSQTRTNRIDKMASVVAHSALFYP